MRVDTGTARDVLFTALYKADGDRQKAAAMLGKSLITLNRNIRECNLFNDMERMGWITRNGPPRKVKEWRPSVIHLRIMEALARDGALDYSALAQELYASDNAAVRNKIYKAMDELRDNGRIALVDGKWRVVDDTVSSDR